MKAEMMSILRQDMPGKSYLMATERGNPTGSATIVWQGSYGGNPAITFGFTMITSPHRTCGPVLIDASLSRGEIMGRNHNRRLSCYVQYIRRLDTSTVVETVLMAHMSDYDMHRCYGACIE
jgi:hypothetical protein